MTPGSGTLLLVLVAAVSAGPLVALAVLVRRGGTAIGPQVGFAAASLLPSALFLVFLDGRPGGQRGAAVILGGAVGLVVVALLGVGVARTLAARRRRLAVLEREVDDLRDRLDDRE